MNRRHEYQITTRWTGNLGTGTSGYARYSRDHELLAAGKEAPVLCSSDPAFRGDRGRYSPEELLVGALSACHMLWVLHLCADARIAILSYTDDALGEMAEHGDGSGEFTRVVLFPRMIISDGSRIAEALEIHGRAHRLCFIARSMNFPVEHKPEVTAALQPRA